MQTGVFGLALWLKCALAGVALGAAIAATQIFPGRWHPAWAQRLVYWFSCPLFAGVAAGVLMALRGVPPSSEARLFWLILCMVITGFTAVLAAGAVAYLSRNYDPKAASKAKRVSRRSLSRATSRAEAWEDKLRALFRAAPATAPQTPPTPNTRGDSPATADRPGQKAQLPPERHPPNEVTVRLPHYAGKPKREFRSDRDEGNQGKLEKPIK